MGHQTGAPFYMQLENIRTLVDKHPGEDVFVVATGPSLAGFDFSRLNQFTTIAVNDAVTAEGFEPTYHLFSDIAIWRRYPDHDYGRTKIVCQQVAAEHLLRHKSFSSGENLLTFKHRGNPAGQERDSDALFTGRTVANAGMLLAAKVGAHRIFLLGVDGYRLTGPDPHNSENDSIFYFDGSAHLKGHQQAVESRGEGERLIERRHSNMTRHLRIVYNTFMVNFYPAEPQWPGPGVYNLSEHSIFDFLGKKIPIEEAMDDAKRRLSEG